MLSGLVSQVEETLEERRLFSGAQRVLVACSGGPDSQVLLHVLSALRATHGCELIAASVDHGLRPEAAGELALVEALAGQLGLRFLKLQVTVPAGSSRQAQARTARYAALLRCAAEHAAERIAVGHSLDDQAETVVARLLRGTSIEGLSGIVPRRADGVVRPLIDVRRVEIMAYAAHHDLPFARDPSNQDARYLRVRIRRDLLPALALENPRLPEQLAALAEDARDVASLIEHEVKRAKAVLEEQGVVPFLGLPGYVRRATLKSLAEQNARRSAPSDARAKKGAIQRTHLVALERMLRVGGQVRLPGNVVASLDPEARLCFSRASKRGRGVMRRTKGST
jgi:tRNA(Ile)-lysidine synthase